LRLQISLSQEKTNLSPKIMNFLPESSNIRQTMADSDTNSDMSIYRNSSSSTINGDNTGITTPTSSASSTKEDISDGDFKVELQARGYKRRRTVSFSHAASTVLPTSSRPQPSIVPTIPIHKASQMLLLSSTNNAPITPPASPDDPEAAALLSRATHVLSVEACALAALSRLYQTDGQARGALVAAIEAILLATGHTSEDGRVKNGRRGKVLACAVGKSAFVARKLVATLKSLGVAASFLHATEALHGDLGDVSSGDVVIFVTFSGKTRELIEVAQCLASDVTIIALTAWTPKPGLADEGGRVCPLLKGRAVIGVPGGKPAELEALVDGGGGMGIVLPAPIHESEESTFGVSAPTTSTTVAMAVCDMLALTVAERIHGGSAAKVFARNHPGGAIGARLK
jgi:D-arabinose 5-phosphate isomerase GutQ